MNRPLSRREFLRVAGAAGAASVVAACGATPTATPAPVATKPAATAVPTAAPAPKFPDNTPKYDLSKSDGVRMALVEEGQEVTISSWGFSGMGQGLFPAKFAEWTQKKFGCQVKLNWPGNLIDAALRELPVAGKQLYQIGCDVVDKEEDSFDAAMALNWYEPIDMTVYKPILTNMLKAEPAYLFKGPAEKGGEIYGSVYQGYEWFQGVLRKDKVDVNNIKNWSDLARPELKGKVITYAMNDWRGHAIFAGFVNQLIKDGKISGALYSQPAWEAGFKWWKDNNMEGQILKWGDIGNDPIMQGYLQQGTSWAGCTWGVYTRNLLGKDWNQKDDVLAAFYPATGMIVDRETCAAVRGCKHPVAARVLIDWMQSVEFNTAGYYKAKVGEEAKNVWGQTDDKFLVAYCGGTYKEMRDLIPDKFVKYFHPNPASVTLTLDWKWYNQNAEWITKTYEKVVKGV